MLGKERKGLATGVPVELADMPARAQESFTARAARPHCSTIKTPQCCSTMTVQKGR
jgi:hypothetical protein